MTVETSRNTSGYDIFKALVALLLLVAIVLVALAQNVPQVGAPPVGAPEAEATVVAPEAEATVSAPEAEATVVAPEAEATVSAPEAEATVSAPEAEATVAEPEAEATVSAPEAEATVAVPEAEATEGVPEAEAAVGVPELKETDVDQAGSVTLNGTGTPGATIEILEDGIVVGTAVVQDDGSWTFTYTAVSGEHTLAAQNQGEPDSLSAGLSVQVTAAEPGAVEETPVSSEAPPGQVYVVQRADRLSDIALQFWGDPHLYPLIIEATNAKAAEDATFSVIYNPNFIYLGQKLWIPDR